MTENPPPYRPSGPQPGGQPPYGQPPYNAGPQQPGSPQPRPPQPGQWAPGPQAPRPADAGRSDYRPAAPSAPHPATGYPVPAGPPTRNLAQQPPGRPYQPTGQYPAGPPPQQPPNGPYGGGPGWSGAPNPGKKRSATPWIAAAGVIVLAAAAVVIVLLTNNDSGTPADPASTEPQTVGTIRAYPSLEFTTDPAEAESQKRAQQVGEAWVKAVNAQDLEAATRQMCARNAGISAGELFGGLEQGSMKPGNAAVNGKKGSFGITYSSTNAGEQTGAVPMVLEDDSWTICLA